MFEQVYLYEEEDGDTPGLLSAIFLKPEGYYVEIRVAPYVGWVIQNTTLNYVFGRNSCMIGGDIMLESKFETPEEAKKYFWSFVNNPDLGFMEASL